MKMIPAMKMKEPTVKMPKGKLTPTAAARVRAMVKGAK